MVKKTLDAIYRTVPLIREFPSRHVWFDYDKQADVLYINFEKPQRATDSVLTENNVLIRRRNAKITGLTIINASKFKNEN